MNSYLTGGVTSRRTLLTRTALGAAAVAAAAVVPRSAFAVSPALTYSQIPGTGDFKVLNYALALEALEADLYNQAMMRLTIGGTNALGKTIPGLGINPNAEDVFYIREFGKVEIEHRDFLNAAIGSGSLLNKAPFNTAKFDFGIQSLSRKAVMDLVYKAEQTGVTAYLGAIPLLADRTYLQTAGAIQGTEARHTAVLADALNELFGEANNTAPLASQNNGRDMPATPDQVLAAVSPFIVLG